MKQDQTRHQTQSTLQTSVSSNEKQELETAGANTGRYWPGLWQIFAMLIQVLQTQSLNLVGCN